MTEKAELLEQAYEQALLVRERAYAPYSNFKVGAAFKLIGEKQIIAGCNVENASFGATICAERNAVLNWVATYGRDPGLEYLVIVAETANAVPCGMCLQVLSEFCGPSFPIYIGDPAGIKHQKKLVDFLPAPFLKGNVLKV